MDRVRKALSSTDIHGLLYDEPMKNHTSFGVGGPADCYVAPATIDELISVLDAARGCEAPVFVLGSGANILVSDRGIRGVVIDMHHFDYCVRCGNRLTAGAGVNIVDLTARALIYELSGLEFIHGMPGSVGGSVWMNARCYETSIVERIVEVGLIDENLDTIRMSVDPKSFSYKRSPYQQMDVVITEAVFELYPGTSQTIVDEMESRRADRERKGHYRFPSVGSVFKNNRAFGEPTGAIIDGLELRGFAIGGAKIADYHANIVINQGQAAAADILSVIEHVERIVEEQRGFVLEREVLLVGDWE